MADNSRFKRPRYASESDDELPADDILRQAKKRRYKNELYFFKTVLRELDVSRRRYPICQEMQNLNLYTHEFVIVNVGQTNLTCRFSIYSDVDKIGKFKKNDVFDALYDFMIEDLKEKHDHETWSLTYMDKRFFTLYIADN